MTHIVINEVSLRDGLQNLSTSLSVEKRLLLLDKLIASGLTHFEVASFVREDFVPQMAGAAEMQRQAEKYNNKNNENNKNLTFTGLVPNERGYQFAAGAGARNVALVVAATDTFNLKNIKMDTAQAMQVANKIIQQSKVDDVKIRAYISTACECPFTGTVSPDVVMSMAAQFIEMGADEISVADTTGAGNPQQIIDIVQPLVQQFGAERFNLHLHDTRGMALANVWAGLNLGITNFDSSIGGLGGCPFSPGASGNLATEDLVHMLEQSGFDTGVDFNALCECVADFEVASQLNEGSLGGHIMNWWKVQKQKTKNN